MENKISLRSALSYFWDSPKKWIVALSWFGLIALIIAISMVFGMISIIPLVGLCVLPFRYILDFLYQIYQIGYVFDVTKVAKTGSKELPEVFQDVKGRLLRGLFFWLISIVYSLPLLLVLFGIFGLFITPIFVNPDFYNNLSDGTSLVLVILIVLASIIVIALALALGYFGNAALYRYMDRDSLGAAFEFGRVLDVVKRGFSDYLRWVLRVLFIAWVMALFTVILAGPFVFALISAGIFSSIEPELNAQILLTLCATSLPLIVLFVISLYVSLFVQPHLLGQLFRVWSNKKLGN